jgi:hypothetical protein
VRKELGADGHLALGSRPRALPTRAATDDLVIVVVPAVPPDGMSMRQRPVYRIRKRLDATRSFPVASTTRTNAR